jgi:hypothetical protein
VILRLNSSPPVEFYGLSGERSSVTADLAYHALVAVSPIRIDEGENPTCEIQTDRSDMIDYLGVTAQVYHQGVEIFSGVVRRLSLSAGRTSITLEASEGATPHTSPINLRETTVWGAFRSRAVIPWVYGRTAVRPLEYSPDRKSFVLADHAVAGIDAVFRNNLPELGYVLRNGADSSGSTVAFIDLVEALGDGEDLRVELRGLAAETAEAIIYDVAGITLPGLHETVLAGVLDAQRTRQSIIREVLASVGYGWAPGVGAYELWPAPGASAETLTDANCSTWNINVDARPAGKLTVAFARDAEQGDARGAAEYTSEGGADETTIEAPWLTTARDAAALGLAASAWLMRTTARFEATVESTAPEFAPGSWVDIGLHGCPITSAYILGISRDYQAGIATITAQAQIGAAASVELSAVADAYYPVAEATLLATLTNGVLSISIKDATGLPIVAADVTLDGIVTRRTDNGGNVAFTGVQRGTHRLIVERAGFAAQLAEITP